MTCDYDNDHAKRSWSMVIVKKSRSPEPVYRPVMKFGKTVKLDEPELERYKFKPKTKKTKNKDK